MKISNILKKYRNLISKLGALTLAILIYPLFVMIYTLNHVYQSDLEGGGNGPLDAYRHTLASAVVTYTLGDWAVNFTSYFMESKKTATGAMDRHNNHVGAKIGSHAKSFKDIEPMVHKHVLEGACCTSKKDQTTWLPKEIWRKRILW
jgi:hypothetical protein